MSRKRPTSEGSSELFSKAKKPCLDGSSIRDAKREDAIVAEGPITALASHPGDLSVGLPPTLIVLAGTQALRYSLAPSGPRHIKKGFNSKVRLTSAAWSADGKMLSIGDQEGMIRILIGQSMQPLRAYNATKGLSTAAKASAMVSQLQFATRVGRFVVAALTVEGQGLLQLWRFDTEELVIKGFPVHSDVITSMHVRPESGDDSKRDVILTTSRDGSSKLVSLSLVESAQGPQPRFAVIDTIIPSAENFDCQGTQATSSACESGAWFQNGIQFCVSKGNGLFIYKYAPPVVDEDEVERAESDTEGTSPSYTSELLNASIPHSKMINDVSISRDGSYIVTCAGDEIKMINAVDYQAMMVGLTSQRHDLPAIGEFLWHKNVSGKKHLGYSPEVGKVCICGTDFLAYGGTGSFKEKGRKNVFDILQCRQGSLSDLPVSTELANALECKGFWQTGAGSEEVLPEGSVVMGSSGSKTSRFPPAYKLLNEAQHKRALDLVLGKPKEAAAVIEELIERGALKQALTCHDGDKMLEDRFIGLLMMLIQDFDKNPRWSAVYLEAILVLFSANEGLLRNTSNPSVLKAVQTAIANMHGTNTGLQFASNILTLMR